jgi:hypothetical protein
MGTHELAGFEVVVTKEKGEQVARLTCSANHAWIGRGATEGDAIERMVPIDPPLTECKLCTKVRRGKSVAAALARG